MNWANSSLKCQPCMGREVNTRFKYCLIPVPIPEETGMKAFKKYPIPILGRYEIHWKNPRIPGLVLYRYSKVDTRMTRVHSPSPMWKENPQIQPFFFPNCMFLSRLCEAFAAFHFFCRLYNFQSQTPLSASSDGHHFLSVCTVKKYNCVL